MLLMLFVYLCLSVLRIILPLSSTLAEPLSGRLTLAGSSTVQPLAEVLAQEFAALHPEVRIDVQGGGSAVGTTAPQSGLADIGMVSRALHAEETQRLRPTTFALDGIALIVPASNPVSGLSSQQVSAIYSGVITHWKVLGGADARIIVVNKEEGHATLEVFEQYFDLQGKFVRDAVIIGPNGQAIATVAGNPHAIAYVSIGAAEAAAALGTPIKLLALDGIAATSANVQQGTYRLIRPLNFVTVGAPQGLAKAFLEFVLTPAGQQIVQTWDFAPLPSTVAQQ